MRKDQFISTIAGAILLHTSVFTVGCSATGESRTMTSDELKKTVADHQAQLPKGLERREITSESVKQAIGKVPRQYFVPEGAQTEAYEDTALAIGFGQTISQPFIVALMTESAGVSQGSKVLEIGTGSGYQAAVLAELGATVFSVEIIPDLSRRARQTLDSLGYQDIHLRVGDGALGWPEQGPFDAILVTAASPKIPAELVGQLARHGKMVIPIEYKDSEHEELLLIERNEDTITTKRLGTVRFVPLVGSVRDTAQETPISGEPVLLQDALRGFSLPVTPAQQTSSRRK